MGKSVRKLITDQSGSALMLTLLISGILMVLALAAITLTNNDYMITEARDDSSRANYVANSAVEIIKQQIADYENSTGEPLSASENGITIAGGQYDYTVTPTDPAKTGEPYTILVTSRVALPNGATAQKKIELTYLYPGSSNGGGGGNTPPGTKTALDFAVYQGGSNGMLHFDGGEFKCIGDIHSNSKIQLKDNDGHRGLILEGTVSSAKEISLPGDADLTKVVLKENQPVVPLLIINWNYIRNMPITEILPSGSNHLNGTSLTGNEDVIFADGNLTITGNVTPNALIVATGSITIMGNYNYPNSDYNVVGMIAGENINFVEADSEKNQDKSDDWTRVRGFVIALNDLNINCNTKIEGTLVAGNDIRINGFLNLETEQQKPSFKVLEAFGTQVISNSGH